MRSAPIGAFFAFSPEAMDDFLEASTRITHTDSRALTGAKAIAYLAAWTGGDPLADRQALLIVVFPLLVYVTYAFYGEVEIKSPCDGDRKK